MPDDGCLRVKCATCSTGIMGRIIDIILMVIPSRGLCKDIERILSMAVSMPDQSYRTEWNIVMQ